MQNTSPTLYIKFNIKSHFSNIIKIKQGRKELQKLYPFSLKECA